MHTPTISDIFTRIWGIEWQCNGKDVNNDYMKTLLFELHVAPKGGFDVIRGWQSQLRNCCAKQSNQVLFQSSVLATVLRASTSFITD